MYNGRLCTSLGRPKRCLVSKYKLALSNWLNALPSRSNKSLKVEMPTSHKEHKEMLDELAETLLVLVHGKYEVMVSSATIRFEAHSKLSTAQ